MYTKIQVKSFLNLETNITKEAEKIRKYSTFIMLQEN